MYCSWEVPGTGISIKIAYDVIDRVLTEGLRDQGLTSPPKVEVGGILVGSIDTAEALIISIDGFVPVACEYSFGPFYVLSPKDGELFGRTLAEWGRETRQPRYAIGFYRTHTRERLALLDSDLGLLLAHFPRVPAIALLLKPGAMRSGMAKFFVWHDGRIRETGAQEVLPRRPAARRPVDEPAPALPDDVELIEPETHLAPPDVQPEALPAAALASAPPPAEPEALPAPPLAIAKFQDPPPAAPVLEAQNEDMDPDEDEDEDETEDSDDRQPAAPRPGPRWFSWWIQAPLLVGLLLADGLLAYKAMLQYGSASGGGAQSNPYGLSLAVARYGDNLHLLWNRHAPVLGAARHGVLWIEDAGATRKVDLTAAQLRAGSVIYHPRTPRVNMRIEIVVSDRVSVVETWQSDAATAATTPAGETNPIDTIRRARETASQ